MSHIAGPKVFEMSSSWFEGETKSSADRSAHREFRRFDLVGEAITYFFVLPPWSAEGKFSRSVWSGTVPKGWFPADEGRFFRSLKTWGRPCPVVAACDSVRQRVGKGGGQEWGLLNPRERFSMNVLPVGHRKVVNGAPTGEFVPVVPSAEMPNPQLAHVIEAPPTVYDGVVARMREPGVGNITRPDQAVMVGVKKTGKDTNTKYTVELVGSNSPTGFTPQRQQWYRDTNHLNEVLGSMYDLDKLYPEPDEARLRRLNEIAAKIVQVYGNAGPTLNAAGGLTPFAGMPAIPGLPPGMQPFGMPGSVPPAPPTLGAPAPFQLPPAAAPVGFAMPAVPGGGAAPFTPPPPPPGAVPGQPFIPPPLAATAPAPQPPSAPAAPAFVLPPIPPPPPGPAPVQAPPAPPAVAPASFQPPTGLIPMAGAPPLPPPVAPQASAMFTLPAIPPPPPAPAAVAQVPPPPLPVAPVAPPAPAAVPTAGAPAPVAVISDADKPGFLARLKSEPLPIAGPNTQPKGVDGKPACFRAYKDVQAGPNAGWCGDGVNNKMCRFLQPCKVTAGVTGTAKV